MSEVSVIIPTFNRVDFVTDALASVFNQTHSPLEVIVVDDGSTDKTEQIVRKNFASVRYIRTPNRGVSSARNTGIANSEAPFIAFLDSDDIWHMEKIKKQMEFFETNSSYKIVHCDELWIRDGYILNQKQHHRKSGGDLFYKSLTRCIISPSSVLIKRALFNEIGTFDENLPACEDYDLWLRITCVEKIGFLNECLVTKRGGHADQLSRSTEGLDQYRIRSLAALISHGNLTDIQTLQVKKELKRKIAIYREGALKRDRFAAVDAMNEILCKMNLS